MSDRVGTQPWLDGRLASFRSTKIDANPEGVNQYSGAAGAAEKASHEAKSASARTTPTGESGATEKTAGEHTTAAIALEHAASMHAEAQKKSRALGHYSAEGAHHSAMVGYHSAMAQHHENQALR